MSQLIGDQMSWEGQKFLHVLSFVHVPRPSPLTLSVFMARHPLPVDLFTLLLPPLILLLLLPWCWDVEVCAGEQNLRLLLRPKKTQKKHFVSFSWAKKCGDLFNTDTLLSIYKTRLKNKLKVTLSSLSKQLNKQTRGKTSMSFILI